MKKPTHAERQAHKALPHDSILESLSPAVASECGAVDGRPAPPSGNSCVGKGTPSDLSINLRQQEGLDGPFEVNGVIFPPVPTHGRSSSGNFLYRYAKVSSRTDSPDIAPLLADGWTIAHEDPRYGTLHLRKELPDAFPRASRASDRGDVDSLHAARDLVLLARSRTTHAAVMGIAALLAALVLLGCAFLALEAWNRIESAARDDGVEMSR